MPKWSNEGKTAIAIAIVGIFITVLPEPVHSTNLALFCLFVAMLICLHVLWQSTWVQSSNSRRARILRRIGGSAAVVIAYLLFGIWSLHREAAPPSPPSVSMSLTELTDIQGEKISSLLIGALGSMKGTISERLPKGCNVEAFMRRLDENGHAGGDWLRIGFVLPEHGVWEMSNTQFRVPHDWGEESNAEIRITATATLVSTPLETDFTDQCGRGIVRHPSFKLKVLVPTIAVMSVAGISTERTSSTPVPPQGSIEGTGSVRFPQDWRVGAYVSSIAGDGSHTAWVLKGPVSVSDGKWSISGVDFRLPGHTGSTRTTMLVVAGKDLPPNLQQNEIRSLQGTANIQPEVIAVMALAPEVTITRSDCGWSSAAVMAEQSPGRRSQHHRRRPLTPRPLSHA